MATATFVVALLILVALAANGYFLRQLCVRVQLLVEGYSHHAEALTAMAGAVNSSQTILSQAIRPNTLRTKPESSFDKDSVKIPSSGNRYVPVARRRAEAERASLGPQSHADEVRANNARVMETL